MGDKARKASASGRKARQDLLISELDRQKEINLGLALTTELKVDKVHKKGNNNL